MTPSITSFGSSEPDPRQLFRGQRNGLLVGHLPHVVALEAEVLHAEARLPGTHHVGAPRAEVLNPAGADAGVVEVDPVVGERLLVVDHERDQAQGAVAQAFGSLDDLLRRSGVEDQHELAERDARQHGVDRHLYRPPVVLHRHSDDGLWSWWIVRAR